MGKKKICLLADFLYITIFALYLSTKDIPFVQAGNCGQNYVLEDNEIVITTPNYPEHYDNNLDCQWIVEKSTRILDMSVTFTYFSTETLYDLMSAGHGLDPTDSSTTELKDESGWRTQGLDFVSDSEGVWITFESNSGSTREGFRVVIASLTTAFPPIDIQTTVNPTTSTTTMTPTASIQTTENRQTLKTTAESLTTNNQENPTTTTTTQNENTYRSTINPTTDSPINTDHKNPTSSITTLITDNPKTAHSTAESSTTDHDNSTNRIQTTTLTTDNRKTVHPNTVIPTSGNPSSKVIPTSGSPTTVIPSNGSVTTDNPTTRHSSIVTPTEPADQCGKSYYFLEDKKIIVTSPNYPDNYPSNIECQWLVEKIGKKNILVSFTEFNTEKNSDTLNAGQGLDPSNDSTVVFQDESGTDIQGLEFLSTSSGIWITFKSDDSGTDRGFSVELVLTDKTTSSMNYTLEVEGNLETPHWPDRTYLPNTEIQWLLRATSGLHVLLEFIDFNLQKDFISTDPLKSCPLNYDTVKIYDGTSTSSPIVGVFCGSEIPAVIESSGQPMLLVFKSDGYIEDRGFSANFSSLGLQATEKPDELKPGDAEAQKTELWPWVLIGIGIVCFIVCFGLTGYLVKGHKNQDKEQDVQGENLEAYNYDIYQPYYPENESIITHF